jgi:hypothetical protein
MSGAGGEMGEIPIADGVWNADPRTAAGINWNTLGMIHDDTALQAKLRLRRAAS